MNSPAEIENLVEGSGYPVKRVDTGLWSLKVDTGLIKLTIELVLGSSLLRVRTRGYLVLPAEMKYKQSLIRSALVADGGLARFKPVIHQSGRLGGVEVEACMPYKGIKVSQIRALVSGVIEAAVWRSSSFKAIAMDLPPPPEFPAHRDPSLGILWTGA